MSERYFHITPLRNLQNILENGIIPYHSQGITTPSAVEYVKKLYPGAVYVTDDVSFIIKTQCTDEWCVENKPVVIQIKINIDKLQEHGSHDFIYKDVLDKKDIICVFLLERFLNKDD